MRREAGKTNSEFISFLIRHGYLGTDVEPVTHTLMDGIKGGKISLPDEAVSEFFAAYGTDMERTDVQLCVVERNSRVFKMHFDVDFPHVEPVERVHLFLREVYACVSDSFPGELPEMVVCAVCEKAEGARTSGGLHIIFPRIPVDQDAAIALYSRVLERCESTLEPPCGSTWNKVLDACVLSSSGFRLCGSCKSRICEECKNNAAERSFCRRCRGRGRLIVPKIYRPWAVYPHPSASSATTLKNLSLNIAHAAKFCSVRISSGAVCSPRVQVLSKRGTSTLTGTALRSDLVADVVEELLRSIRSIHCAYAQVEIAGVQVWCREIGVLPRYAIKLRGEGCRYCINKGAEHASSTSYFIMSKYGLAQRCFSRKPAVHRYGTCGDFTSNYHPLTTRLSAMLFQEAPPQNAWFPELELSEECRSG